MSVLHLWPWALVLSVFVIWWFGVYFALERIDGGHSVEEASIVMLNLFVAVGLMFLLPTWFGNVGTAVLANLFFLGDGVALWRHSRSREAWIAERRKQVLGE